MDSPATPLLHAARVVAQVSPVKRADTALRYYFEANSWIQPPLRREISRAVFVYFRWVQWLKPKSPPHERVGEAARIQRRFEADQQSVKPEALALYAVPDWLGAEMELPAAYLRQLQQDPALWIRARPGTAPALAATLGDCAPTERSADALRYTGQEDLFLTAGFQAGAFEIQDLASQLVGLACAPRPGESWWDACAGEGGKTLHLCDLMQNKGIVWASDRHSGRLETLKRRTARAKLYNYRAALWDGGAKLPTTAKFDGILVDAPCSGVGTWQRNPHARWSTTPKDVRELALAQLALLDQVAGSLKPGGRLVYAVCTLTRTETVAVAEAFSAAHPELEAGARATHWPHELNANGMFIAQWTRKK
jgi:16S rRNA (cytosine967-C5)-methyltransferase